MRKEDEGVSSTDNTLKASPTGEEVIPKILEYIEITTEGNGMVVYSSGFSQGAEESTNTTTSTNFEDTDCPKSTEGEITNNNTSLRKLNLSRIFDLESMFENGYGSDGKLVSLYKNMAT